MAEKGKFPSREPGRILPDGTSISFEVDNKTLVLGGRIADGGSAIVRRSLLLSPNEKPRSVATKIFRNFYPDEDPMDPKEQDNEAKIQLFLTQALNTPNILPLELYGTIRDRDEFQMPEGIDQLEIDIPESGIPLIVTKLASETLQEGIRRGPMTPYEIAFAIGGIANGLAHVHEKDIVHGDIKPGNIFLVGGHWMIGDWGTAMSDETGQFFASSPLIRVTFPYTAPERLYSLRRGPETDQYSTAVVLYEAATGGKSPYSPAELLQEQLNAINSGVRSYSARISDRDRLHAMLPFEEVTKKGMNIVREARYSDMRQFKEAVEEAGHDAAQRAATGRRSFRGEDVPGNETNTVT